MSSYTLITILINMTACTTLFGLGVFTIVEAVIAWRKRGRKLSLGIVAALFLGGLIALASIGYFLLFFFVIARTLEG